MTKEMRRDASGMSWYRQKEKLLGTEQPFLSVEQMVEENSDVSRRLDCNRPMIREPHEGLLKS